MKEEIIRFFIYLVIIMAAGGVVLIISAVAWNIKEGLRRKKRRQQFKRFKLSEEDKRIINVAYERRFIDEQGRNQNDR